MQRNFIRRVVGTLCFLLLILAAHAQKYTVTGGKGTPLLVFDNKQPTSSQFQVYLVYGMDNVEIRYTPTSGSYQWYRYKTKAKAGIGSDAEKYHLFRRVVKQSFEIWKKDMGIIYWKTMLTRKLAGMYGL